MKNQLKGFACGIFATLLVLGAGISTYAITAGQTIQVNPINIQVNGEVFQPTDVNGEAVPVFTYNGTTYAPLRALAEAYGLDVWYDESANLAAVGPKGSAPATQSDNIVPSTEQFQDFSPPDSADSNTVCAHSWKAATCTSPEICTICGNMRGTSLNHDWIEATCTHPATCKICNVTKGTALDHNWIEATGDRPKTCQICGETSGSPLRGADYQYGGSDSAQTYTLSEMRNNVKSLTHLNTFLKAKYKTLYSPVGELKLDISAYEFPALTEIKVDFSYVSVDPMGVTIITPLDLKKHDEFSSSERKQTVEMLRELMENIYKDAHELLPEKKFEGSIYVSGYRYPHIKVDYYHKQTLTWSDISGTFQWKPDRDDFELE